MLYQPPTVAQLKEWRTRLGYTGTQMANILGLKTSRRWRDYADENKPQGIPPANLFMAAAFVTLSAKEIARVLDVMREVGAVIDPDSTGDGSQQD